ncbi:MAG TPA: right-handed parallel beta-helix repeat-containing protein [Candidatus Angelobacter sp.]|jgi:hypothetical protein|nr:right-handed parallel beta-helix repeat-containing protein [Candidatus Angelobacter sp.]
MKLRSSGPKLLCFFLLLFLLSTQVVAQVTVGCPGGTPGTFSSLGQAIFSSPDHSTFLVSGTCTENIDIQDRSNLSFFGNPTATIQSADPDLETLIITFSKSISFNQNLIFTGGQGITISGSPNVRFNNVTVQNSGSFGITSADSVVHILKSSVTGNTRSGVVITGGAFYVDGNVNVTNNGRLGISAGTAHLVMGSGFGTNIVNHNGLGGIQVFGAGQADLSGDNQITSNGGDFAVLVLNSGGLLMSSGIVNSNTGLGIHCGGTSHCELSGTHVDSNGAGGIEIVEHSDASLDGAVDISGNTGAGILVDQSSSLTSLGSNTISNNTGDGLILNTLSALKFVGTDTITATTGNLALNCNNGSLVEGDVTPYKPRRCGAAFQDIPIH